MDDRKEKGGGVCDHGHGSEDVGGEGESFSDSAEDDCHGRSSSSETSSGEESRGHSSSEESSKHSTSLGWPMQKLKNSEIVGNEEKSCKENCGMDRLKPKISDMEMMKERFAKLLLGEDMSGSGKGVCTALAISNATTNLCATLFGQLWRLEPLPPEKKSMWLREMDWLLCVSDHIVELVPTWQTFPDGSKLEVMTCRQRSDLYANLPALRKLDNMLLEILDSFSGTEFWYADQGVVANDSDGSASFRKALHRQEEKWWLPVPRVPPAGLHEKTRKQLQHKRECANQILKAAMAINSNALAEMEVPEPYLESLPKELLRILNPDIELFFGGRQNGRACLGDVIYRYISSDQFSPECLLDCLDLSSEHQALEIANHVEASIYIWRRRTLAKSMNNTHRSNNRSSWGMVKDIITDAEKRELLADRAKCLLLCLKQRFPGLTQTTLDTSKIQFNKDVGKSILESYSRVLESLAYNIVARIDDLLCVDDLTKRSDQFPPICTVGVTAHKKVPVPCSVPVSGTPYATAYATPSFLPAPLLSPVRGERSPLMGRKSHNRGYGVKKVLTNYLGAEVKGKDTSNRAEVSTPIPGMNVEA